MLTGKCDEKSSSFLYASDELSAMSAARNYNRAIVNLFRPYLRGRTIEVGAGIGTITDLIRSCTSVTEVVAIEPALNNYRQLQHKYNGDEFITIWNSYLEDAELSGYDCLVAVNVLEHVEADERFLLAAYDSLTPGGHCMLFVPALPQIQGSLDVHFQHFRRYTAPSLKTSLTKAGFKIERLRYVNSVGVVSWFIAGRVIKARTISRRSVLLYDKLIIPWLSRMEATVDMPFGQSLVAIASR